MVMELEPLMSLLLRRSNGTTVLFGVCGGLGHYFGRRSGDYPIAFVALAFAQGVGVLAYLIAALVIQPESTSPGGEPAISKRLLSQGMAPIIVGAFSSPSRRWRSPRISTCSGGSILSIVPVILIVLGAVLLIGAMGVG